MKRRPASTRAIGYVRVSTEEQAHHGVSIDAQVERIRAYCLAAGLQLSDVVTDEGVSGAKPLASRPGGARVCAAAVSHIVALKLDRLFRDAADALQQSRQWDQVDIALHLVDMGGASLNTRSAMGRMFLTIAAAFAELERNVIAERTSFALQHKKRHGQVYGPVPYGYERAGSTLETSDGELEVVSNIRQWRAEGRTFRWIADRLNESGVRCKRGGRRWYAATVARIVSNKLHTVPVPSEL